MATSIAEFEGFRLIQWTNPEQSMYLTTGQIYPIIRIENNDVIITDNMGEQYFCESNEIQWLQPMSDKDAKIVSKSVKSQQNIPVYNQNRPDIKLEQRELSIQVELDQSEIPYWATYIIIDGGGIVASVNPPDVEGGMRERVVLTKPIVIKLPKEQKPFEILANLYKEGKITYEELESEMKLVLR